MIILNNIFDIFKNINISGIASITNKTLGVVRKSIPIYKEIKPLISKNKPKIDEIIKKENKIQDEISSNDNLTFFN